MTPKAHRLLASLLAWCLLAFGGLEASAAEIPGLAASTSSGQHIYDDAVTTTAPSLLSVDSLNDLHDAAQHFYAGSEPVYAGLGHCLAARGGGRGKNKLKPDGDATGSHSTWKTDADGNITGHAEWKPNPRNPSGFDQAKRVDTQHANPHSHGGVPTPHTHSGGGVRPATPDELPK